MTKLCIAIVSTTNPQTAKAYTTKLQGLIIVAHFIYETKFIISTSCMVEPIEIRAYEEHGP